MFIRAISVSVLVVAVLHCVAGTEQCSLGDSVGKLLQSCQALKHCPDGWKKNTATNSCYLVIRENLSWSSSRSRCQSFEGADMASLTTKEEMGFAFDLISSGGFGSAWIGLERSGSSWRWLDGSMLTISSKAFWQPGEPNDAGRDEDYVHMYDNGLTNDNDNGNRYYTICEMKL